MRPYLGPTVRIKWTVIYVGGYSTYNPEHITEMESVTYLWHDAEIYVRNHLDSRIIAEDFQLVLNSPKILQCQNLWMVNAHFSFKDYKVLFAVKVIETWCGGVTPDAWLQFLEQPGIKPVVVLHGVYRENITNILDRLLKAFSCAVSPNQFKIIFVLYKELLTVFRETNNTSEEILELRKGVPTECQNEYQKKTWNKHVFYTLARYTV